MPELTVFFEIVNPLKFYFFLKLFFQLQLPFLFLLLQVLLFEQKNITLSRAASGFLHLNPTGTVIDTTQSPPVVKDWLILDFELTSSTNLRIKRQSHNNTALSTIKVLIFND